MEDYLDGKQWNHDVEDYVDDKILDEINKEEEKKSKKDYEHEEDEEENEDKLEKDDNEDENEEEEQDDGSKDNDKDNDNEDENEEESDEEVSGEEESDDEKIISDRAKEISKEYNIDDEKKAIEMAKGDKEIADKYDSNPLKIAHQLRIARGKIDSINQQMIDRQKELSNPYDFQTDRVLITTREGKKIEVGKEDFVKQYKEKLKEDKELQEMSDDEVFREAKRRNKEWLNDRFAKVREKIKNGAEHVRGEIMKSIPDNAKRFEKDIKSLVDNFPDESLVSKEFDKKLPIKLILAENIDTIIKEAERTGYEKGKKNIKVVKSHEGSPINKGKKMKGKEVKSYSSLLNKKEQKDALDMFEDDNISDEKKFELFYDLKQKK